MGAQQDDTFKGGAVENVKLSIASSRQRKPIYNYEESVRSNLTAILGRTAAYLNREVTWDEIMNSTEKWTADLKLRCSPAPHSVLRHARVHLVAPGQDAALHIAHMFEARRFQNAAGARAAHAALAMDHDVGFRIQFTQPLADFAQRNQLGRGDVADLVFVGFAHVDQDELIATVQLLFDCGHFDFALGQLGLLLDRKSTRLN